MVKNYLEGFLELIGLIVGDRLMLLEHDRQSIVPRERLVIGSDLSGCHCGNIKQEVESNSGLEQLLFQLEYRLGLGFLHRRLQLHQLICISRSCQALLRNTLILGAQLLVVLKVLLKHALQQLVHKSVRSLGQRSDELLAVELEHADANHFLRVVRDVLGQTLVFLQLALVLVEGVVLTQEQINVLLGLPGYQAHVFVKDFGVDDGALAFFLNLFTEPITMVLNYFWQDDWNQAVLSLFSCAWCVLCNAEKGNAN